MAASYLPYEPDQDFLLPPSLSEWLPEGHLAYFISDSVDALDLSAFRARCEAGGRATRQFSMRGLDHITAEWKLVCPALNLRRMCTLQPT